MVFKVYVSMTDGRNFDLGKFDAKDSAETKIADVLKNGHSFKGGIEEIRYPYWAIQNIKLLSQNIDK